MGMRQAVFLINTLGVQLYGNIWKGMIDAVGAIWGFILFYMIVEMLDHTGHAFDMIVHTVKDVTYPVILIREVLLYVAHVTLFFS